ncbi:MAG: GTPase HflX [Dehalococcoidales bacterium]|nr:MAG: GTPase HflX [Dehalococcoidales bacterium]
MKKGIDITKELDERAFLVGLATKNNSRLTAENSMGELSRLAGTAGARIVGSMIQRLPVPSKSYYIGEGKLTELTAEKDTTNYNVVIFDDELSPLQQRNLEDALGVKVLDRVALILDIFAKRARTREGQLQVELAQHQYLSPRLAGQWSHLERLGGGIGTRGPGESQLETDRRIIQKKIGRLKSQIEQVRKQRMIHRRKRSKSGIPVVALVGYTNAGKSTLLNILSKSDVVADDKLFVTLDPTTRRLALPDSSPVLMTDTVGFIRKLPPAIVAAFRATLEELDEAELLLHVVDLSSPDAAEQCQAVEEILASLELTGKPTITVLNKIDLLLDYDREWKEQEALEYLSGRDLPENEDAVMVSAEKKWGLTGLMEKIGLFLAEKSVPAGNPPK